MEVFPPNTTGDKSRVLRIYIPYEESEAYANIPTQSTRDVESKIRRLENSWQKYDDGMTGAESTTLGFTAPQYGVILSAVFSIFAMIEIVKKVVEYCGANREAVIREFVRPNPNSNK